MSNLYGIGLSGLSAARAGLSTASNNISNVNTPGYTREQAQLSPSTSGTGQNGVRVTGIKRYYEQYLTRQLDGARSRSSALDTHLGQVSQINNLLGDKKAGLAPLIQSFFSGLRTVAANPEDAAARQSLLGDANSLASQFQTYAGFLDDRQAGAESQIEGDVGQINNYATQIDGLNEKISQTRARTGQPPNTLLDQRDQLVSKLSELADANVTVQDNGHYSITVGSQAIVDAEGAHPLKVVASKTDPTRNVVAYQAGDGSVRRIADDKISGGSLGGLLAFRDESLTGARNNLNQLAHALAAKVNAQHEQGTDLANQAGGALFTTSAPASFAGVDNASGARLDVAFNANTDNVTASNYQVRYNGGAYQVTRLSDGNQQTFNSPNFSFGGVDVTVNGSPADNDSFIVKPAANAAAGFEVAISDASKIAAGQGGGIGDNRNAQALANLQNADTVGGNRSFNSAYAQLVSDVGSTTRTLQVNGDAQQTLTQQIEKTQQSIAGVNLDEENVNLLYYQQMYQANAKVIQTASTLFDTLLGISR